MITALYTDGGVCGLNPSPIGGTWSWCHVDESGHRVRTASGLIVPDATLPRVTNNLTELAAIVYGLEALPQPWTGVTVFSDSYVSIQRVFLAARLNNVPAWLVQRLQRLQRGGALADVGYQLLSGHPTRAQLAAGVGKNGLPVSHHNVWCDQECTRRSRTWMAEQTMKRAA